MMKPNTPQDWKHALLYGPMFMVTAQANQAGFWMLVALYLLVQLASRPKQ